MEDQTQDQQTKDQEERDLVTREYRSLVDNLGWHRLLDRLDRLKKHREVEKSKALHNAEFNAALLQQGFIDGITFVMGEPNKNIKLLNPSEEDQY